MGRGARSAAGPRLRIGVPFTFSTHALLMARWLGPGIEIRTVPPPQMAAALAGKEIDLFCVGEPWGTVAAEAGVGTILSTRSPQDGGLAPLLSARFPALRTRAPLRTRPDVMVTVDAHVVEPLLARRPQTINAS